eukprot:g957.t1
MDPYGEIVVLRRDDSEDSIAVAEITEWTLSDGKRARLYVPSKDVSNRIKSVEKKFKSKRSVTCEKIERCDDPSRSVSFFDGVVVRSLKSESDDIILFDQTSSGVRSFVWAEGPPFSVAEIASAKEIDSKFAKKTTLPSKRFGNPVLLVIDAHNNLHATMFRPHDDDDYETTQRRTSSDDRTFYFNRIDDRGLRSGLVDADALMRFALSALGNSAGGDPSTKDVSMFVHRLGLDQNSNDTFSSSRGNVFVIIVEIRGNRVDASSDGASTNTGCIIVVRVRIDSSSIYFASAKPLRGTRVPLHRPELSHLLSPTVRRDRRRKAKYDPVPKIFKSTLQIAGGFVWAASANSSNDIVVYAWSVSKGELRARVRPNSADNKLSCNREEQNTKRTTDREPFLSVSANVLHMSIAEPLSHSICVINLDRYFEIHPDHLGSPTLTRWTPSRENRSSSTKIEIASSLSVDSKDVERRVRQQMLHELILFGDVSLAETLCRMNSPLWNSERSNIPLVALRLGLQFQELSLVEVSLRQLEGGLRMVGNSLMMEYLRSHWYTCQDRNLFNNLLDTAEKFVMRLVDSEARVLVDDRRSATAFVDRAATLMARSNIDNVESRSSGYKNNAAATNVVALSCDLKEIRQIWFFFNHGHDERPPSNTVGTNRISVSPSHFEKEVVAGDVESSMTKTDVDLPLVAPTSELGIVVSTPVESHFDIPTGYSLTDFNIPMPSRKLGDNDDASALNGPDPTMYFDWNDRSWRGTMDVHPNERPKSMDVRDSNKSERVMQLARDISVAQRGARHFFDLWRHMKDSDVVRDALVRRAVPAALAFLTLRCKTRALRRQQGTSLHSSLLDRALQSPSSSIFADSYFVEPSTSSTVSSSSADLSVKLSKDKMLARRVADDCASSRGDIADDVPRSPASNIVVMGKRIAATSVSEGRASSADPDAVSNNKPLDVHRNFLALFSGSDVGDIGDESSPWGFQMHDRCRGTARRLGGLILKKRQRTPALSKKQTGFMLKRLKELRCARSVEDDSNSVESSKLNEAWSVCSAAMWRGELEPRGYSHVILDWVRRMPRDTRHRILIDKMNHLEICKNQYPWEHGHLERTIERDIRNTVESMYGVQKASTETLSAKLRYSLSRYDREGTVACVRTLDLRGLALGSDGRISEQRETLDSLGFARSALRSSETSLCSDSLVVSLAERGIFMLPKASEEQIDQHLAQLRRSVTCPWKPWASVLLAGRLGDRAAIYESSLANAKFCGFPTSPSDMLKRDMTLMAIGTLMYAPEAPLSPLSNISAPLLRSATGTWPSLQVAFSSPTGDLRPTIPTNQKTMFRQEVYSWKGDVGLFALLSDTCPFDLTLLETQMAKDDEDLPLHFSSPALLSSAHEEDLGAEYYLSKARPLQAFYHCFLGLEPGISMRFAPTSGNRGGSTRMHLVLQDTEEEDGSIVVGRLQRLVRRVALNWMEREDVLAACIVFLKACDIPSEALRVDVEAAKRVLRQRRMDVAMARTKGDSSGKESKTTSASLSGPGKLSNDDELHHEVVQLFMRFDGKPSDIQAPILVALRLLGEATAKMVKHKRKDSPSESRIAGVGSDLHYPESPWKLVTLFCRTHGLPRSMALLQELARTNDWVIFLHEAQREQCDLKTVLRIVRDTFTDRCLKEHLHIAMRNTIMGASGLSNERPTHSTVDLSDLEISLSGEPRDGDIFDILFNSKMLASPAKALLRWAIVGNAPSAGRRPILAIVASCDDACSVLESWIAWLVASCDLPLTLFGSVSSFDAAKVDPAQLLPPQWTRTHLNMIVSALCRRHCFVELVRSFRIFAPQNVLFDFVLFYEAFVRRKPAEILERHLHKFVRRARSSAKASDEERDWNRWALDLAQNEVTHLLEGVEQSKLLFECGALIKVLAEANFSTAHRRLHTSFDLLKRTELLRSRAPTLFRRPRDILNILLGDAALFKEARRYTLEMLEIGDKDLVVEDLNRITLAEVSYTLRQFRSSAAWRIGPVASLERRATWKRCWDLFSTHNFPRRRAANFFLAISQDSGLAFGSEATEHFSLLRDDHVELLQMVQRLLAAISKESVSEREELRSYLRILRDYILLISLDCGSHLPRLPPPEESTPSHALKLSASARRDVRRAIDELLRKFDVDGAKQINESFGERSKVLAAVLAAQHLAQEDSISRNIVFLISGESADLLPLAVVRLLQDHKQEMRTDRTIPPTETLHRKSALFNALLQTAPEASLLCIQRIAVTWRAARLLRRPFADVCKADASAVLRTLLLLAMRHRSGLKDRSKSRLKFRNRGPGVEKKDDYDTNAALRRPLSSTLLDRGSKSSSSSSSSSSEVLDILDVASIFVQSRQIDPRRVAAALARFFYDASMVARSLVQVGQSSWQGWSVDELQEYVGLSKEPRLLGMQVMRLVRDNAITFASVVSDDGEAMRNVSIGVEDDAIIDERSRRTSDENSLARLPVECEVQLLIVAHYCNVRAGFVGGVSAVLSHIRRRIALYETVAPVLLLRLLVGTREFKALEFVIGRLLRECKTSANEMSSRQSSTTQLERLLGSFGDVSATTLTRSAPNEQRALQKSSMRAGIMTILDEMPDLRTAILRYISQNHSGQVSLYTRFCLRLGMCRELAEVLHLRADVTLKLVVRSISSSRMHEAYSALYQATQLYIEAARYYLFEDAQQLALKCQHKAALVILQEQFLRDYDEVEAKRKTPVLPSTSAWSPGMDTALLWGKNPPDVPTHSAHVVVGLTRAAARTILTSLEIDDALVVAAAYELSSWTDWVPAVYARCVTMRDSSFLVSLSSTCPIPVKMFDALTHIYRQDAAKAARHEGLRNCALSQDDLKTLINGPEPGQEMPPNSDPNSLDGNLKDKRKQQIVINDLAQRIQLHQEKKDIIAAKTTASIISNRRLPEGEEEDIGVGDESSELREVQEEAMIARDKVLNNEAREKNAEVLKSDAKENATKENATETRTYDCSLPPTYMSDAAFVWCSGRHKDGRPSETDGMIIV